MTSKFQNLQVYAAIFVFVIFFASSCGKEETKSSLSEQKETVIASEEAGQAEFQPEQIFTYENAASEESLSGCSGEIRLRFSDAPIEISGAGFARFIGYIDGLLLIEIGGEGRLLNIGDAIGDYKVSMVRSNEIKLERDKNK